MPPTSRNSVELMLDRLGLRLLPLRATSLLTTLFITAIVLGVARLVFLAILALVPPLHGPGPRPADARPRDRAAGQRADPLLQRGEGDRRLGARASWSPTGPKLEVLVLDDGSTDAHRRRGARSLRRRAARDADDASQNGGKAQALNRGLARWPRARSSWRWTPTPCSRPTPSAQLARWFADPQVGAVAGNALVGNRLQPDHPLAGAGICHRPEPGAARAGGAGRGDRGAGRRRRLAQVGAGGARRLSRTTPWPRTRT